MSASNHILKHLEDECRQNLENIEHKECLLFFSVNPRQSPTQDTPFQTPGSTVGGVGGVEEASYEHLVNTPFFPESEVHEKDEEVEDEVDEFSYS